MKKKIIVISDFIENKPFIASVRYTELMEYFKENYDLIVVNNLFFGDYITKFSEKNFKFRISKNKFSKEITTNKKQSCIEKILRNKFTLSLWKNYSNSKYKFDKINGNFYLKLDNFLRYNKVDLIFVTIPEIQGLYIAQHIKQKFNIPIVVEVRDIINHSIGKGNPKYIRKKAERMLQKCADKTIVLSEGIYDYYKKNYNLNNMKIIKNGYNENLFKECFYKKIDYGEEITFTHIGSIYEGRDLKSFLQALINFSKQNNIKIKFDIVGYLDEKAIEDLNYVKKYLNLINLEVNIIGMIEHEQAIKYLKESDVAVILTHKFGSEYAIPGKTFEYIGACKPILAVTEDKGLIKLVNGKYGTCVKHNVDSIVKGINELINKKFNFDDRESFSRKKQAKEIFNFIEGSN